jgi:hypothetical protein
MKHAGTFAGAAFAAIALAAAAGAMAAGPAAVRRQAEASMLVTGTIQEDPAGKVSGFTLDQKDKLPAAVVEMLDRRVPAWTFEPVKVDGRPAHVRTQMSVRLIAKKIDETHYEVRIGGTGFGDVAEKATHESTAAERRRERQEGVCHVDIRPPSYPRDAARAGVASSVYLLLKVDREGRVLDAVAEQVNLKVVDSEAGMERWRQKFTSASLATARKWCLEPPQDLKPEEAYFVARVPVMFWLQPPPAYGQWDAYVPGPRQRSPWQSASDGEGFSPDTLAPGRAYTVGSGLKLLTDPSKS